ncbi:ATP-binding protein [Virgibacillus kimchii]
MVRFLLAGICFFILTLPTGFTDTVFAETNALILDDDTEVLDVYEEMLLFKDREDEITITDLENRIAEIPFVREAEIQQQPGFFMRSNWLRFEVENQSATDEWLLEFAFPLIYELQIYQQADDGMEALYDTGAVHPFDHRPTLYRNFVFDLEIEPNTTETYFVRAVGSGDLHPPINIWDTPSFLEKQQVELILLGIFYGTVLVMILYNFFLYLSLRMRSYLYYVLVILLTLMGKLSINGLGFQYLWPDFPEWNAIATPVWVSLACIMIVIFSRSFLDLDYYLPKVKYILYLLVILNVTVILLLFFNHFWALSMMVISALATFITIILAAGISLLRGARQARFFLAGWLIFLTGVSITILERTAVLPFNLFTEYAGQGALTLEVVLLSFALADKINMMRREKEAAEAEAAKNQEKALENLKQADKLKDEFIAVTSHELRTPLYGMIGIAESIREGGYGPVNPALRNQLSMIMASGQRLTQLVNDILDLSVMNQRSLKLKRKKVHASNIVENVCLMCQVLVKGKPVELINRVGQELAPIYADPARLQQVMYNLVDNAVKYTEEGSVIIEAEEVEGMIRIDVKDTGIGISEEDVDRIFLPFQQLNPHVDRETAGLGLGLAITRRLVDMHEGRMEVSSFPGEGTEFSVQIPLYRTKWEGSAEQHPTVSEAPIPSSLFPMNTDYHVDLPEVESKKMNGTILVVDDELVNVQIMINHLAMEHFRVLHTTDGNEAYEILENHEIDLVILDLMMPSISGYQVCRKIRECYSLLDLPILMLTATSQSQSKVTAFESGANDYLVKPFDKSELLSRVKTLVRIKKFNRELMDLNQHLEEKVEDRTAALHKLNHELMGMNEQLIQMAKSRRDMLQNIAHELGTPVTIIHSYMQSLKEGLVAPDDAAYAKLVTNKLNILQRLIQDLYELALLENGRSSLILHTYHLGNWLSDQSAQIRLAVQQKNRRFEGSPVPERASAYEIQVDRERMGQVFLNLISNAVKHTSDKEGAIAFKLALDEQEQVLTIHFSDNGTGMSDDALPQIFERFYKGQPKEAETQESIGLGLAIVKKVMDAHQGQISVNSKIGKGTTFSLRLPVHKMEGKELEHV